MQQVDISWYRRDRLGHAHITTEAVACHRGQINVQVDVKRPVGLHVIQQRHGHLPGASPQGGIEADGVPAKCLSPRRKFSIPLECTQGNP